MNQALAAALWLTGILACLAMVGATVRWLWQTGTKATRVLDALLGEPPSPGSPNGRPGALDRIASIEERVSFLEQQMRPNGGSSLRDTVDRIAAITETQMDGGST